jgi:hypothetical protein
LGKIFFLREVFGVDWGVGFQPYQSNKAALQDLS